jgi:transcriptional regulator with XRE-family HTH domain
VDPQEFMGRWGLDQQQLADRLGITAAAVARWFYPPTSSNYGPPHPRHLARLAELDLLLWAIRSNAELADRCPADLLELAKKNSN